MDDEFKYYLAVYICMIEDSDQRKAKISLRYYETQYVTIATESDPVCQSLANAAPQEIFEREDLNNLLFSMRKHFEARDKDALYVVVMLFGAVALFQLETKQIAVDDFIGLQCDDQHPMAKILLQSLEAIASTPARRVFTSRLLQTTFLYSPYYGRCADQFITGKIGQSLVMDIFDGLNGKNPSDVTEAFNLLIVLLSQLSFDLASLLVEKLAAYISERAKRQIGVFPYILYRMQAISGDLSLFVQEAVMYLSLLSAQRELDMKAQRLAFSSDFFQKLDDAQYVNRYVSGLCFIPHALLYHYSFGTYLYAESVHLQTDLLGSLVQDVLRNGGYDVSVRGGAAELEYSEESSQVVVLYSRNGNIFNKFGIVTFERREGVWRAINQVQDGLYECMQVHGSIPLHLETLALLKQDFLEETRAGSLQAEISGARQSPIRLVLRCSTSARVMAQFAFPALSFGQDAVFGQVTGLLARSLRRSELPVKGSSGEKPEIQCGPVVFTYSERLGKLIKPLKAAQLACVLHILTDDALLIVGAPGTGKTYTAASIIRALLLMQNSRFLVPDNWKQQQKYVIPKQIFPAIGYHCESIGFLLSPPPKHQIILCAHSNNAIDQMAAALLSDNFPLLNPFIFRLGSQCESSEIKRFTVEGYIQLVWNDLVKFKLAIAREQPRLCDLYDIMRCRSSMFEETIEFFKSRAALQTALTQKASILVVTTSGIHASMRDISPGGVLIMEEAARVAEYNVASLLQLRPWKMVLIGDVLQLPPVIKDAELATKAGLVESFFHKAVHLNLGVIVLDEQMRVHTSICDLYREAYCSRLPRSVALKNGLVDADPEESNCVFAYQVEGEFESEINEAEASDVTRLYERLGDKMEYSQISVLSLYKKHAIYLSNLLKTRVFTVDEYQGLENDVIILSLAVQRPSKFASDLNRTLVAFSRARKQLHVVGNIRQFDNSIFEKLNELAYFDAIE